MNFIVFSDSLFLFNNNHLNKMKDILIKTVKEAEELPHNQLRRFLEEKLRSDLLVQAAFLSLFKENYDEFRKQFVFSKDDDKLSVLEFLEEKNVVEVKTLVKDFCDLEQSYARCFVLSLLKDKKINYEDIDVDKFIHIPKEEFIVFMSQATGVTEFEGSCYFSKGKMLFFDSSTFSHYSSPTLMHIIVESLTQFNLTLEQKYDYEKNRVIIKINNDGTLSPSILKNSIPISKDHSLFFYSIFARQRAQSLESKIKHYVSHIDKDSNFEHLINVVRQFHEFIGVDENPGIYNLHNKTLKLIRNYNGHATLENEPEKNFLLNFVKTKNEIDRISLEIETTILETLELFDIEVFLDRSKIKNLLMKNLEDVVYETSNIDYIIEIISLKSFSDIPSFDSKEPFITLKKDYLDKVDKINKDKSLNSKGKERKIKELKESYDLRCSLKLDFENNLLDFQVNGLEIGSVFWMEVYGISLV